MESTINFFLKLLMYSKNKANISKYSSPNSLQSRKENVTLFEFKCDTTGMDMLVVFRQRELRFQT